MLVPSFAAPHLMRDGCWCPLVPLWGPAIVGGREGERTLGV